MSATVIPFRKRRAPSKAVDPDNLDSLLEDLFERLHRMHGETYPDAHARILVASASVRPLPAKGELVRRVLERAQARRDARRPGGAG